MFKKNCVYFRKSLEKVMFPYSNMSANYHLTFNAAYKKHISSINIKKLLKIIAILI